MFRLMRRLGPPRGSPEAPKGKSRWAVVAIGLLALPLTLAVACQTGVAQTEYDAVKAKAEDQEKKVAALQSQLSAQIGELTQLKQQLTAKDADVAKVQAQVTAKEQEIATLNANMGKLAGVVPVIYTKIGPTPGPRPTPTPAPAGYVPPTPVPPDPAWVNEVLPFTFYVETNTGHQTSELIQNPSCVVSSQFRRGTHLVWRFEVVDASTGKRVTSLDTPTIKVVLPTGQELTARYSKRGGTGPWMWAAAWDVPRDYPLGALDYQITVKDKNGKTGMFDQDTLAIAKPATATAGAVDSRVMIVE